MESVDGATFLKISELSPSVESPGLDAAIVRELFRQEVMRARAIPPEEKLLAGERLFEWACSITLAGIREQHPEATEEQQRQILAKRLALGRKLEKTS